MPKPMQTALKEWQLVIDALAAGRQVFLLRKGGIAEGKSGFEPKHRKFVFFPTWEHQHTELVKPGEQSAASAETTEEEHVKMRHFGEFRHIALAPEDPAAFARADEHYIWNERYIAMRYGYRPELPLYLLTVRLYRLPQPAVIPRDRRYKGCRSWVMLYDDVPTHGASPALDDETFAARQSELLAALGLPPAH